MKFLLIGLIRMAKFFLRLIDHYTSATQNSSVEGRKRALPFIPSTTIYCTYAILCCLKMPSNWLNLLLFPKRRKLGSPKLKEFADVNSKFDENSGRFSKKGRKHCGKRRIAPYEQFLHFPQCFQTTWPEDTLKPGSVWERVNFLIR